MVCLRVAEGAGIYQVGQPETVELSLLLIT